MNSTLPDFHELEAALTAVGAHMGAAESQGLLCGMCNATSATDAPHWIARVLEDSEPKGEPARRCLALLAATWQETFRGLDDSNLELDLLLPGDDEPLAERAMALGTWCQGFLYGIGQADGAAALPTEVNEAITSLAEIARIDFDSASEADEPAFAELVEFVRVATLLVREHMQPLKRDDAVNIRLPPEEPGSSVH